MPLDVKGRSKLPFLAVYKKVRCANRSCFSIHLDQMVWACVVRIAWPHATPYSAEVYPI